MSSERIQWADYAKAIAIILVVFHHSISKDVNSELYSDALVIINDTLTKLRMPLLFFVSGLFIHKTIKSDFIHFFKFKVTHLLYLYLLWSLIRYITVTIPENLILGGSAESLSSIIYILTEPQSMLWFIYALVIFLTITWATSAIPALTLALSAIFFTVSISNPYPSDFLNQLSQYFPLYLLGYFTSDVAKIFASKVNVYYLVIPLLFLIVITKYPEGASTPSTAFLLACGGIVSGIVIATLLSKVSYFSWLSFVGKNTLPIYVMHYLPLGVIKVVAPIFLPNPFLATFTMLLLGVITPLVAARVLSKIGANWLLESPFLYKDRKTKKLRVAS